MQESTTATAESLNIWKWNLIGIEGFLCPTDLNDWTMAGRVLAKVAVKYGYEHIGRGRLTNDALIAMSAAREGIRIVTSNGRDFGRLAGFSPFPWQ
jgi:predicted nucleic acid-binding protein